MDRTDPMDQDVLRWVALAQGGDEAAFGELVKQYQGRVYGLAYGLVRNTADAEELAQQTWVRAWQKLGTFKREAQFFTWVYRIASNLCLDHLRRRHRRQEEPLDEVAEPEARPELPAGPSAAPAPDEAVQQRETREQFERALEALKPEHRLALRLREIDGLSYEEIARTTGCRVGTVMSRLFYARKKLIEQMRSET